MNWQLEVGSMMNVSRGVLAAVLVCCGGGQMHAAIEVFSNNGAPGDSFTNAGAVNTGQAVGGSSWYYNNVRVNGVVGINTTNPRSGDGSVFFSTPAVAAPGTTNGKADIEFYSAGIPNGNGNFGPAFSPASVLGTLGALSSLSYEWYRDSTSTNSSVQHPSLRLSVVAPTGASGYLVFERAYNSLPTPTDAWAFDDVFGANYRMWSTGSLPSVGVTAGSRTIGQWMAEFPDFAVVGVSSGVGSGWGQFTGAVDNITFGFGGNNQTYNFEVERQQVVPEPMTLMVWSLLGLCGSGFAWRARRRAND